MTHTAHRILWTVVGLLVTALGATAVLGAFGKLPGIDPDGPLLWSGLINWWRSMAPWGPFAVVGIGLLLALLGFVLLNRISPTHGGPVLGELISEHNGENNADESAPGPVSSGRTLVRGTVLAHGLERDVTQDPLIRRASVLLTGTAPHPRLCIRVHVGPGARLTIVRNHVREAVDRFRITSGLEPEGLEVTAQIDSFGASRVD